jgi:beta-phosphoglucomutase-like phosphatase (HAD superfamily)
MHLDLPPGDFKAYLFDCDGTIVDSMPLHYVAWTKALAEYGCTDFTEQYFYSLGGYPIPAVIEAINRRDGSSIPIAPFMVRYDEIYFSLLPDLKAVPEVLAEIHRTHGNIPFAVVSGSIRESVVKSLTAVGILDLFDTLVCAGDYEHGKPAPDPFLMGAARLGVEPKDCLVFEDAEAGIQAAKAAGMTSVRILQPWERETA